MSSSARLAALLWVLLLIGCAINPPVQEMSDARQAIKAAREASAERYAPGTMQSAEEYLRRATEELDQGNYVQARESAVLAKECAIEARDKSLGAAERK